MSLQATVNGSRYGVVVLLNTLAWLECFFNTGWPQVFTTTLTKRTQTATHLTLAIERSGDVKDKSNMIIVIDFRKDLLWTNVCLWLFFWKRREEGEDVGGHCLESKRMKEWDRFSSNSTRAFSVWTFINSADMQEKKRPLYKWGGGWYRRGDMNHVKAEGNLTLLPYVSHMCCAIYSMCSAVRACSHVSCMQKMEYDDMTGERAKNPFSLSFY